MAVKKYDESSVQKLRGIEPVQRLPGMYTRTTDPTHIIQEAIDNAADEAFGGHADRIDVTLHRDGSVTVTDNGPGIAPEHLPRITERFYRVDRSRSRETGGTGLGLSIVKHVVQRHQGELTIESQPGLGSRFIITLPANRVRALPEPSVAPGLGAQHPHEQHAQ